MNIVEDGPSVAATLLTAVTRMSLRTALSAAIATPLVADWPWPYGIIDTLAGLWPRSPHARSEKVHLTKATAQLIHGPGVPLHTGRVILYLHGGGFLTCGTNTHRDLITRLSKSAQAPVFAVDYRMVPHSLEDGLADCFEAYLWLRDRYEADQIAIAGDSAGGYMAMALATRLAEKPAALALLSPLLELDPEGKRAHPNLRHDAMFNGQAFDALLTLLCAFNDTLYEPLDHLSAELPPVLIHVSGHEILLHDAVLAEELLTELGVPVEVVVWPGQIHVFQFAATLVPEGKRSLDQLGQFIIEETSKKVAERSAQHRTATVG